MNFSMNYYLNVSLIGSFTKNDLCQDVTMQFRVDVHWCLILWFWLRHDDLLYFKYMWYECRILFLIQYLWNDTLFNNDWKKKIKKKLHLYKFWKKTPTLTLQLVRLRIFLEFPHNPRNDAKSLKTSKFIVFIASKVNASSARYATKKNSNFDLTPSLWIIIAWTICLKIRNARKLTTSNDFMEEITLSICI